MDHLNITWHHDWWADNVNQRMPRSRRGKIHILNSLFTATGNSYCSNAGQDAQLLVEGTVYNGVKAPFQTSQNGIISAPSGSNQLHQHVRHDDGDGRQLRADVSVHRRAGVGCPGRRDGGRGAALTCARAG